jgi:hypothetical protein
MLVFLYLLFKTKRLQKKLVLCIILIMNICPLHFSVCVIIESNAISYYLHSANNSITEDPIPSLEYLQ